MGNHTTKVQSQSSTYTEDLLKVQKLATFKFSKGEYECAACHYKVALALAYKIHGKYHQEVASIYNSLSHVMICLGKYEEAYEILREALEVGMQVCNRESPLVKDIWKNIGSVFKEQGKFPESLVCYEKVLSISSTPTTPETPQGQSFADMSEALQEIAIVYKSQGKYEEALSVLKRSLESSEAGFASLEASEEDTAKIYNIIGGIYFEQKDFVSAFAYYNKALRIQKKEECVPQKDIIETYMNIASVCKACEEFDEAIEYSNEALEEVELSESGSLCELYNTIGTIYAQKGELNEAMKWYIKALDVCARKLGGDHPLMGEIYDNMGARYTKQKNYTTALQCYKKALEIRAKAFKNEHLKIAESYDNIGDAYRNLEKADDSMNYYSMGLVMRQHILGEEHILVAESHLKMGKLSVEFKTNQGLKSLKESLRIYEKLFGKDNLATQEVLRLIDTVNANGRTSLGLNFQMMTKIPPMVGSMEIDANC